MYSDPIPQNAAPDRTYNAAAEHLARLYEELRRRTISNYTVSRERYTTQFKKLAKLLDDAALEPRGYMLYAYNMYKPNPYVNMVCSKAAVKAYKSSGAVLNRLSHITYEIELFEERAASLSPKEAARELRGRITNITMYLELRKFGCDEEALNFLFDAEVEWMFCSDDLRNMYRKRVFNMSFDRD